MTNLTTEEMQRIVDGAPEGYTHYLCEGVYVMGVDGKEPKVKGVIPHQAIDLTAKTQDEAHKHYKANDWHSLGDLRKILAQQQEIERLCGKIERAEQALLFAKRKMSSRGVGVAIINGYFNQEQTND